MAAVIDETTNLSTASPSQASSSPLIPSQRIHYLDNLRALAMLLGIFLHSALAYAHPAQFVWLATDTKSSVTVDASIWFIHLFRMGLFFLLSGYFAKLVIKRKGMKHFLKGRCLRVVAPFLLFYPFLLAGMTIVIVFALSYIEEPKGLMGLIAQAGKNGAHKPASPGTMHLWFLYYLMYFTMIGALLHKLNWVKPIAAFRHPLLLVLTPLILVPGVFAAGCPLPAPDSFLPHWWPFAVYGMYYYAGWQLLGNEPLLERWSPYAWHIVAVSIIAYIPYYWMMPKLDARALVLNAPSSGIGLRLLEATLTAYLSVLVTIACLLLGQRYLTGKSGFLSFVADSSYWAYLLHLPIVIFLQTLFVPLDLPVWLKLSVVVFGTLIACSTTYLVFVRYTPVGWLLHGKRSFP
jgi:glucans biosynthesis protein C